MTDQPRRAPLPLARAHELVCARSELSAHAELEAERATLEQQVGYSLDYGSGGYGAIGAGNPRCERLEQLRAVLPARVATMRERLVECAARGMLEVTGRPTDAGAHEPIDAVGARFDFDAERVMDASGREWLDVNVAPPGRRHKLSKAA